MLQMYVCFSFSIAIIFSIGTLRTFPFFATDTLRAARMGCWAFRAFHARGQYPARFSTFSPAGAGLQWPARLLRRVHS